MKETAWKQYNALYGHFTKQNNIQNEQSQLKVTFTNNDADVNQSVPLSAYCCGLDLPMPLA